MICKFCAEADREIEIDVLESEIVHHPKNWYLSAFRSVFRCPECGAVCVAEPTFAAPDNFDYDWTPPPELLDWHLAGLMTYGNAA